MKRWRPAASAAVFALLSLLPPVAHAAEPAGRVSTITRLVRLFLDKEASLASAARNADGAALARLLADDFELRTGARAANPVPRAQWMAEILRTRDPGGEIRGMAVHDFGAVAVASFTQDTQSGRIFVVDVWRGSGTDWKLQVRYASPAGTGEGGIPGAGAVEPEIQKKY